MSIGSSNLADWFEVRASAPGPDNYVNVRLRARGAEHWRRVRPSVTSYCERAHADARQCFHNAIGLSLDPRGGGPRVEYPRSLPLQMKKAYFGEVFCGMLAEA